MKLEVHQFHNMSIVCTLLGTSRFNVCRTQTLNRDKHLYEITKLKLLNCYEKPQKKENREIWRNVVYARLDENIFN
jgi:hypothetical protein